MTPGRVVRMRMSPKACIRIVDALCKLGIDPATLGGNLSFSHGAKKVFESCLIALERDGIIPTRDGFEYSDMMLPFPLADDAKRSRAGQIKFTQLEQHPSYVPPAIVLETYERKQRRLRMEELSFKQQSAPDSFTDAELEELEPLIIEFQTPERSEVQGSQTQRKE